MGNLTRAQFIFARNVGKLINYIFEIGYQCTIGEVLRTKEQAELYAKTGVGIIDSLHLYKLAIDLNLFRLNIYLTQVEEYKKFGDYWKQLNPLNRWGGDFSRKDAMHFEMNTKEGIE